MITRRSTIGSLLLLPAIIRTPPGLLMPIRPLRLRKSESFWYNDELVSIHITAYTGRFEVGQIVSGASFPTMTIVNIGLSEDEKSFDLHCIPMSKG